MVPQAKIAPDAFLICTDVPSSVDNFKLQQMEVWSSRTAPDHDVFFVFFILNTLAVSTNAHWRRTLGDSGIDRDGVVASSAALVRERYAVQAIPTVETNG